MYCGLSYRGYKAKLSEKDREKWCEVFATEMMSSEGSDDASIVVRPLQWCSNRVDNFFSQLDKKWKHKSPQARHEMKEHVVGLSQTTLTSISLDHFMYLAFLDFYSDL